MRGLALSAIRIYQRHLSPHKGFCCAYRTHTGRASCSQLAYRAIRRHGLLSGLQLLRRRFALCGVAHRRFSPVHRRPHRSQRGDCDFGCDLPCDFDIKLPNKSSCGKLLDIVSCCDAGSCDWGSRKRDKNSEKSIHIPPNTKFR